MSTITDPQLAGLPPDTADVLTSAADLLAENGLHPAFHRHGVLLREFWPDDRAQRWHPALRLHPVGAIGVTLGLRRAWDVTTHVVGCVVDPDETCHPAVEALWAHLGLDCLPHLLRWVDGHDTRAVVAAMRGAARACTCVTCGAPFPDHYDWCPQIRPVRHAQHAEAVPA